MQRLRPGQGTEIPHFQRLVELWPPSCRGGAIAADFNLSQIEHLGVAPNLGTQRKDGDVLSLHFQKMDQEQTGRLKNLLAEHPRGFREDFATGE